MKFFDKEKAIKTAMTQWDTHQGTFKTTSSCYDFLLGLGDTAEEAMTDFLGDLDIQYCEWQNGTHGVLNARKNGRPLSGRVSVNTRLKPDVKLALEQLAKLHKKSRGEIIEILVTKLQRNDVTL